MVESLSVLPLAELWYRRLVMAAAVIGVAGGVIALAYSGVTGFAIDRIFGDPTADPWTGKWWWIPVIAAGGLSVAVLRRAWSIPDDVPGAVAIAQRGWVDPKAGPKWLVISVVSLCFGASLGPSFGIVVGGGALGAWLVQRYGFTEEDAQHQYALTGMAGALGAVFSAPLLSAVLASELSPIPKKGYVASFMPQFFAATLGYVVYFGFTGAVMLDAFSVSGYTYEDVHLLHGVALGFASVLVLAVFAGVMRLVRLTSSAVRNPYARAIGGGALIGLIGFALPLTATGGSAQLAWATDHPTEMGIALLAAIVVGKMVAVALSQEAGFLGGTVFPMLFLGGSAGILVSAVFETIPLPLAVGAMIAAMPGASIAAPVSFILIAIGGVGLGVPAIAPIGIAVLIARLIVGAIALFRESHAAM